MSDQTIEIIVLPWQKRFFDIVVSLIFIIISLPLTFFILFWIFLEQILFFRSRGPLFYSETRISKGKEFKFYKWRIFKVGALKRALAEDGYVETAKVQSDKNNLTYYGRFLKRIYMDEMPQLWNVLRGDMTLVGPRPTNVKNSKTYQEAGNFTREVIVCGLTGTFQCEKGHGFDQLRCDREYIKFVQTHSGWRIVLNDIWVLLKTMRIVFEARGI
ncbi:MAG: sugar transferase [bacterium]|nr:sugar transferase [bacterium]